MNIYSFPRWSCVLRRALLTAAAAASIGVSAQVNPTLYQHCDVQEPAPNAAHRIETNYRYAPSATLRTLRDVWSSRCEPGFAQSEAIFDAFNVCPWAATGCSADSNGNCLDGPNDWIDYEALRGTTLSNVFQQTTSWSQNPTVSVHSTPQAIRQWGLHRWWGYSNPTRYAFLGSGRS